MRKINPSPSLERVRSLFDCDPVAGTLRWRVRTSNRIQIGDLAGSRDAAGYLVVTIDNIRYLAHRVIWFHVHGEWLPQIDHRDLVRSNNAITNLRPSNQSQNLHNIGSPKHNTSGLKGACYSARRQHWIAQIAIDGKRHYLGGFSTKEDAHEAYMRAATAAFGEFARAA